MSKTEITSKVEWRHIDWRKAEYAVLKLQKRIYRASRDGDLKAVRKLQKRLMRSYYAKCLAVRRVSQDNQGKKTAGVDGVKSLSPKERLTLVGELKLKGNSKPTRRVWIPKPGTKEKRPLGIPIMHDRALQALAKLTLEPEWEARFEKRSHGFRPGRSAHDAIEDIFNVIRYKSRWVLDADIAKCFDQIDHNALLKKLNTYPGMRRQIKAWLKSGVIDKHTFFETDKGTPQGGVISPLLANIALHGLESYVCQGALKNGFLVRYADDFVFLHEQQEATTTARSRIDEFLGEMGLEVKESKTRVTHTSTGFNFLGFNIRQYQTGAYRAAHNTNGENLGFSTLIKPSKEAIKRHLRKIAEVIDNHHNAPQKALIRRLNLIIKGWCNYYSSAISKEEFSRCDHLIYQKLLAWGKRRRGKNQGVRDVVNKYWQRIESRKWVFATHDGYELYDHAATPIVRHTKVQGDKSPYDGNDIYWSLRLGKRPGMPQRKIKLLRMQKGKCLHCKTPFKDGDLTEIDHKKPLSKGGKDIYSNLQLLHKHCHDTKTAKDVSPKRGGTHDKS
ncbi:MAG TPA: group II intron reverse transcriptase/maturase [Allocoleopsis sp.]